MSTAPWTSAVTPRRKPDSGAAPGTARWAAGSGSRTANGGPADFLLPYPAGGSARATLTAAGVSLLAGLAGMTVAGLLNQAKAAMRVIEHAQFEAALADGLLPPGSQRAAVTALPAPVADGIYLSDGGYVAEDSQQSSPAVREAAEGPAGPLTLAMLGDSTAVGYGVKLPSELPGVLLATEIAGALNRPVSLRTHGVVGCGSADLNRQVGEALPSAPDLVVIFIGANDIRDKVPPRRSADLLGKAVAALRARQIPVVVGTCPDLGVIEPFPQPLRSVLHAWSTALAGRQERAVVTAGGRAVALGRLISPHFAGHPELFAGDRFHPSAAGYAKAVAAVLPAALDEIGASPRSWTSAEITVSTA